MMTRTRETGAKKSQEASETDRSTAERRNREQHGAKRAKGESLLYANSNSGVGDHVHPLLRLQRTHGNQAVQRLVKERIQPKLEVGEPDNEYEREADRVAEEVIRVPRSAAVVQSENSGLSPRVQRLCSRCQRRFNEGKRLNCTDCEEKLQRKKVDERNEETLQIKPLLHRQAEDAGARANAAPSVVHDVAGAPGRSLDGGTRRFMERRFGHDFSQVRVHTNGQAAAAAQSIGARAFTVGQNIAFNRDEFAPSTTVGRRLLAHELTHVVQQSGDAISTSQAVAPKRGIFSISRGLMHIARQEQDAGVPDDAGIHDSAYERQIECIKRLGGCLETRSAGIPSSEELARYNKECRPETGYTGSDLTPTPEECRTTATGGRPVFRVKKPVHPGWIDVNPTYTIFKFGEPFEFPHFLRVRHNSISGGKVNVTALEGRYKYKDADIDSVALTSAASPNPPAKVKFDTGKGQFWYGGKGPLMATTDSNNPPPKGTHDLEIPDFHHNLGQKYGNFGTTWFRMGHSGDRYLHPGRVSLGCTTITETSKWPDIWKYLIKSRKDDQSVGEIEIV